MEFILKHKNAKAPSRATVGSAGYDLYASEEVTIKAGETGLVKTGVCTNFARHMYARIAARSGLSLKKGIMIGAGVIDSDYSGEIGVVVHNFGKEDVTFKVGSRPAQLILEAYHLVEYPHVSVDIKEPESEKPVSDTKEGERGNGGFGSTGE